MVEDLATKDDFDQCIKDAGNKVVCINFKADWAPPCKIIEPAFAALASEFTNCILRIVDVDNNKETAEHCAI